MTRRISIRASREEDVPMLLALYAQPDMDNDAALNLTEAHRIFARIRTYPDYNIYVAESGQGIVATFGLLIMDKLGHQGRPLGIVDSVKVDSAYQGHGIGRQLMRFAMKRCREVGCYKLTLSSNLKRADAHRFYESLGFKKHGYSFIVETENKD